MADSIQTWLDTTLEDSFIRWEYLNSKRLDDTFGWGAIFAASLEDDPEVNGSGLLLTGPDGCGKHTAALHMMKLLELQGYEKVFLEGSEMSSVTAQVSMQRFDALLDRFYNEKKSLCVCLEGLEHCPHRRELLSYWGRALLNYLLYSEQFYPLYLILIDGAEQDIPSMLRDRLRLCRMSLPTPERRAAFLERHARTIRNDISMQVFAEATEGASYGQLLDMIGNVQNLLDSREGSLDDDALRSFLSQQMPQLSQSAASQTIAQSLQQLLTQLPQLLQGQARSAMPMELPVVQVNPASASLAPMDQANFLTNKRTEIENMSPRELAVDLFGEESVSQMLLN